MVAFVRVRGNALTVLRVLRGVLRARNVTTVPKAEAAGHHRTGNTILKLVGTAAEIEAAREVALASVPNAGIEVFQRHDAWIPGGPIAARPERTEGVRPMRAVLLGLEER